MVVAYHVPLVSFFESYQGSKVGGLTKKARFWPSLGGARRFAQASQNKTSKEVKCVLEGDLAYTLHKPMQSRFPALRVRLMGMDHQWVADLVDKQKLESRKTKGTSIF